MQKRLNKKIIGTGVIVLGLSAAWLILSSQFEIRVIMEHSMEPTLRNGDVVLFYQNPVKVNRHDILVFRDLWLLEKVYVKRCIGLSGENIWIKNKNVFINRTPLKSDPGIFNDQRIYKNTDGVSIMLHRRDNFGPLEIPPEHYFLMGDNRDLSTDSRSFGFINGTRIQSKAIMVIWPVERIGKLLKIVG